MPRPTGRAGATVVREDHPLQRRFLDLRAAAAHVQATPRILELTGTNFWETICDAA